MMGFPMVFPPDVHGKIALGTCEVDDFNIKVAAAEEAVGN